MENMMVTKAVGFTGRLNDTKRATRRVPPHLFNEVILWIAVVMTFLLLFAVKYPDFED
jgi:hypothetical protein